MLSDTHWSAIRLTFERATVTTPEHAAAKAAYLTRFPQSEMMFGFSDFSLFAIVPESIRFVGGFAQATTISPETLAEVLSQG